MSEIEKVEKLISDMRFYYTNALSVFPERYPAMEEGEALCNILLEEIERIKNEEAQM